MLNQKSCAKRTDMLIPKPLRRRRMAGTHLQDIIGDPTSRERQALRKIVAEADLLEVDGQHYLLTPIGPDTLDILAAFEAEHGDFEDAESDRDEGEEPELDMCDAEEDDEDCCEAHDDDPAAKLSDGEAGDGDDAEYACGGR